MVVETYNKYLQQLEDNKNGNDYLRASQAGYCLKALKYSYDAIPQNKLPDRVLRQLRIGTIIHEDIQNAFTVPLNSYYSIEKEYYISKLKLSGHADIVVSKNNITTIYDIKSIGIYPYKLKFGNKKDTSKLNYLNELQIGTYGWMESLISNNKIVLKLIYIKKDDGAVKEIIAPNLWIKKAEKFWNNAYEKVHTDLQFGDTGVPYYQWQCNYCRYNHICNSPLITRK